MASIPLAILLKKRIHREVALAQDLMVMGVYDSFPRAVLHGGTAIWRCYRGNRFSEDLDFYLPSAAEARVERFVTGLRGRGLSRQKFKMTKNAIFAKFIYAGAAVSFEAALRTVRSYVVRPFETFDGGLMNVNTLRPEDMVVEKVLAYTSRRKVRDLYDIFFLLQVVEERDGVERAVRKLLEDFKRPSDERALKAIILSGSVPSVESMLEGIEQWAG